MGISVLATFGCKAELAGSRGPDVPAVDAPTSTDDAPAVEIDAAIPLGPWASPVPVPGASDPALQEDDAVLAPSGLELIFARAEADGTKNLYRMTRASAIDAWSPPALVPTINADGITDQTPRMTGNGKTLYFASARGAVGGDDIYMATRQTMNDSFGAATVVQTVNDTGLDRWLSPCDGDRYIMISRRDGDDDDDLFEGTLGTAPTRIPISSGAAERGVTVSGDCLTMYFGSNQGGTFQLYTTTRTAVTEPWPEETPFVDVAVMGAEHEDPFLSEDRRTFLVTVVANGNKDLYISTR